MKKLIEVTQQNVIQCDNPACDYVIPYTEELDARSYQFINQPCPQWGENLLTEADYLTDEKVKSLIKWINRWFSWLTLFGLGSANKDGKHVYVHAHKGLKIMDEPPIKSKT